MTHWAPPPPPSLLACPPAPRLKRQWRDDDGDEPRYASHGFTCTAAAGSQPPRQRRRLSGDEPVLPTPTPQAPLAAQPDTPQGGPPLGYQQQQQQQAAGVLPDLDLPPAPPAEEEPGGSGAAPSSSDDDAPQHPSRRACTGKPGYRLMLPTPLPPAVGLAAPAWAQQLHSQASADAWALVPYSPSLAAQRPADGQREQRGSVPGSQQGGGIQPRVGDLLSGTYRPQLKYDHEQPLPGSGTASMATDDEGPASDIVFEELPPGCCDAMEE